MKIVFEKKTKEKKPFMEKAIVFVAVSTVVFTIAIFLSTHLTGADHSVLTQKWFDVVALELGGLLIKRVIDKKTEKTKTDEERE